MKLILVAGLNPAWQKTLDFERFKPGEVNRARKVLFSAAGKGVNFARAAKIWGEAEAVVAQFAGGANGNCLLDALEEAKIKSLTRKVEAQTRLCTTLLSETEPRMTELIEPAGAVSKEDAAALLKTSLAMLEKADALAICGTFPPGVDASFYKTLALKAKELGKPLLVDSVAGAGELLPSLSGSRCFLKLNLDELKAVAKAKAAEEALRFCVDELGIEAAAATDGPRKAFFASKEKDVEFELPALKKLESPLGAGDTCAAIALSEILSGAAPDEAFLSGLAAASASCLTRECAVFSKERALEIRARIHAIRRPRV